MGDQTQITCRVNIALDHALEANPRYDNRSTLLKFLRQSRSDLCLLQALRQLQLKVICVLNIEVTADHQHEMMLRHAKVNNIFVQMNVGVLDASVFLESKQVVMHACLELHCQLGWQVHFHLLAHMFEVNACELLENTFI